jgi:hypothetical protein
MWAFDNVYVQGDMVYISQKSSLDDEDSTVIEVLLSIKFAGSSPLHQVFFFPCLLSNCLTWTSVSPMLHEQWNLGHRLLLNHQSPSRLGSWWMCAWWYCNVAVDNLLEGLLDQGPCVVWVSVKVIHVLYFPQNIYTGRTLQDVNSFSH